jgi:hypothetical protein
MKRLLLLTISISMLAGCLSTRPSNPAANSKGDLAAEQKIVEKLPLVTPESVTPQNYQAKIAEFNREMLLESQRLDSAKSMANAAK